MLRRNGTPSLFGVLPFEINNENYFSLLGIICTLFGNFPHSSVGWRVGKQSVGRAFESYTGFTFYLSYYKCILGTNVIDFEIFKTVVEIIFKNPVILENIARCPIPP